MKNLILFDLDGTLADCTHRLSHIAQEPKNWSAFFSACGGDQIIPHVAALFMLLRRNPAYEVWIVSGRSDEVRAQTEKWLLNHHLHPDKLIMRAANDHSEDDFLKGSWVESGLIPRERIMMVFEDRSRDVKTWRKMGVPCLQVAEGEF